MTEPIRFNPAWPIPFLTPETLPKKNKFRLTGWVYQIQINCSLEEDTTLSIGGSGSGADLEIQETAFDNKPICVIEIKEGGPYITDIGSPCSIYINNTSSDPLEDGVETKLPLNCSIKLGNVCLIFRKDNQSTVVNDLHQCL